MQLASDRDRVFKVTAFLLLVFKEVLEEQVQVRSPGICEEVPKGPLDLSGAFCR